MKLYPVIIAHTGKHCCIGRIAVKGKDERLCSAGCKWYPSWHIGEHLCGLFGKHIKEKINLNCIRCPVCLEATGDL